MAKKNPPDERVVYLALKNVFKGPEAGIRQSKAVHKLISKHKAHAEVVDLIREHDFETVCTVARTLLTEQIFESTLKAKLRFPEIFDVSSAQSAEREASEAEAAKNESNAIREAVQGHQENSHDTTMPEEAAESKIVKTYPEVEESILQATHPIPSLFPVYLPFTSQHFLLGKVQTILEQACFEFGQQSLPALLQKNRWDCPESAELNQWTTEFQKRKEMFHKKRAVEKPLETLFRSVSNIRHAAVHRVRVSAKGIEQFMFDAESLATLLEHSTSVTLLAELRRNTQVAIEELERNKYVLRTKLEETVKSIAIQRAQLDDLEKAAISNMLKEDSDYQQLAAANLLQARAPEEAVIPSAVASEEEISSDIESTGNTDDKE